MPCDSQDLALTGNNQGLIPTDSRQDLILRSARRARLEGWAQARARRPPQRGGYPARFETGASRSPQGEVGLRFRWVLAHIELFAERCRSSTRIASGTPHKFPDAHSKPPAGSRTIRRLARRGLPKQSIRDFLRSVEGQQKQAMREGTQQLVSPSATPVLLSQALTSH